HARRGARSDGRVVSRQSLVVGASQGRGGDMKVVITGATGQIGTELSEVCAAAGDDIVAFAFPHDDITNRDAVLQAICSARPDAVIHAAAFTAVDACETEVDRAFNTNALGT